MFAPSAKRRDEVRTDYDASAAALGIVDPDADAFTGAAAVESTVELWPDHESALALFRAMKTQWRMAGMGGPIGLDYSVLPWVCQRIGIAPADEAQVFADLRVMEDEALVVFDERASKQR